jgi:hypothetical protein
MSSLCLKHIPDLISVLIADLMRGISYIQVWGGGGRQSITFLEGSSVLYCDRSHLFKINEKKTGDTNRIDMLCLYFKKENVLFLFAQRLLTL